MFANKRPNYFESLDRVYIIAEIGVNHNGDVDLAKKMITAAKEAGANAVKFQTYSAERLATLNTPKVDYQKSTTSDSESHYEMLRHLELSFDDHKILFGYCESKEIDFISTPYDIESAEFLIELGIKIIKTASADLVDLPLQRLIAGSGLPAIVATGMSSLGEIENVVSIYQESNKFNLALLHCVSNYPCSDESLNLRAMNTIAKAFEVPVGYSDHSKGSLAAAISVALGAKIIEKHFTLDRMLPGPDHLASSTPEEFSELVDSIRKAELMLGSSRKVCQPEEVKMAQVSRKSITLSRGLRAGAKISENDLCLLRPGMGIPAHFIPQVLGMRVKSDLPAHRQLSWADLE